MGITLPTGDILVLPEPPASLKQSDPATYLYLNKLRSALQDFARGQFSNTFTVATALNSGTSGVFVTASGGHITLANGVVVGVSTT